MARRKRCVVKRRRKGEGKRRKGEKRKTKSGIKSPKKEVRAHFVSSTQSSFFGPIRNTLLKVKWTRSTLVCMQDVIDEFQGPTPFLKHRLILSFFAIWSPIFSSFSSLFPLFPSSFLLLFTRIRIRIRIVTGDMSERQSFTRTMTRETSP